MRDGAVAGYFPCPGGLPVECGDGCFVFVGFQQAVFGAAYRENIGIVFHADTENEAFAEQLFRLLRLAAKAVYDPRR